MFGGFWRARPSADLLLWIKVRTGAFKLYTNETIYILFCWSAYQQKEEYIDRESKVNITQRHHRHLLKIVFDIGMFQH